MPIQQAGRQSASRFEDHDESGDDVPLLSHEDVIAWVPQATGSEDLIEEAVATATGLAEEWLGRDLASASHDEYITVGELVSVLHLRNWPVTTLTSIQEEAKSTSPTTLTSDSYEIDEERGRLDRDGSYWSQGFEAVRVQYTAGYTAATLPASLKRALLQLVAWVISTRGNVGVKSEGIDGTTLQYEEMDGPVPASIGRSLALYARMELV